MSTADPTPAPDPPAVTALALLAITPTELGGIALRARPGPARDAWLARLRTLLTPDTPWRRLPPGIPDSRLLGGLDLTATLRAGRPVAERGLLAEADGGMLVAPMAERLSPATAARLAATLDAGTVAVERDGFSAAHAAHFTLILLDEGIAEDERPPAPLLDRLALHIDLPDAVLAPGPDPATIAAARARLPCVACPEPIVEALCAATIALGIGSLRAPSQALHAARAAAALAGRDTVEDADAALAATLVLAPRATRLPAPPDAEAEAEPEAPPPEQPADAAPPDSETSETADPPADVVLAAAAAAIPPGLLALLRPGAAGRPRTSGRSGAARLAARRGRPIGARPGDLRAGARLALIETLSAAAPWQSLRRAENPAAATRLHIRPEDIRVRRFRERAESTTLFLVDASGSQAAARLAEAKGAVELLLADCYVRRDRVALIAFRGTAAELLLPPTSSLVRAKRGLAGLPGGGGTPLAAALDAGLALAETVRRGGRTPLLVLLTDGRANVARDGGGGRPRAEADAIAAATAIRAAGLAALLIDTGARPGDAARRIAAALDARYLPLPAADAASVSRAVRGLTAGGMAAGGMRAA